MLYTLAFLALALVASVNSKRNDDTPDLEWPSKYSFEITKYSVASGLVEDIRIWRTKDSSRVEYNHGAVKSVITKGHGRSDRSYHYEIHPETTDGVKNEMVCNRMRFSRWSAGPADILPDTDGFVNVGPEDMNDQKSTKFFKQVTNANIESKETIWAFYDHDVDAWVPARYEVEQFNTWLGSIDRHDIWDFENYNADFNEKKTFDVSDVCSMMSPIRNPKDEKITKHLHFVDTENEDHVNHVFKTFQKKFNKKYAHAKEHEMRKSIFKRNMRFIQSTNRKNLGYTLAVNQFSDRTPEEMKRHMGLKRRPEGKVGTEPFPYTGAKLESESSALPSVYDLRLLGVISPIQNQETCGCCWTIGTTSAIEGAIARNNGGQLKRLSNQALIDCAWEFGAAGCDGGSDNAAYEFVMKYGIPTIADYGIYQNQDGVCNIKNMTNTYKIRGFVDVTPNSVESLKVALINHGPLSVSVDATDTFIAYNGGVFYDFECDPQKLNHEITLVGYGEEYGETFWIVKNSWGPEWGIDGYMHILAKDNNCGIMTEPTYVVL